MGDNMINAGLRRLEYSTDEMTDHGFRATATTLLNESGKSHPDAISLMETATRFGRHTTAAHVGTSGRNWRSREAITPTCCVMAPKCSGLSA
jgi:hypothetical protein